MLCDICKQGLEGIWDPTKSKRLGTVAELFNNYEKDVEPAQLPPNVRIVRKKIESTSKLEPELYVFGHHVSFESFKQSMHRGCVMCNRFRPSKKDEGHNQKLKELGYFSAFTVSLAESRRLMHVRYGDSQGGFEIEPYTGDEGLNFELSSSTGDRLTWNMIHGWLSGCETTHKSCLGQGPSHFVPTRLLELQNTDDNVKMFRLVEGKSVGPDKRYATLSHHKGLHPIPGLSAQTEKSLKLGQLIETLPKTFGDAFEIIDRIGIRHIWIDSLCIYEDSPEDRHAEISVMKEVYRNGFLNIAALGAGDDDAGCFFDRDPREVTATIFNMQVSADGKPEPHIFKFEHYWAWRLTLQGEPLLRRAWFLQERLLAPRTLMFGRKQVFWECNEAMACELHPDWATSNNRMASAVTLPPRPQYHFKTLLGEGFRRRSDDPRRQLLFEWYNIVESYADLDLSHPGDKLAALSAIAKETRAKFSQLGAPANYLAGIWKHSLPESLLWNLRNSGRRPPSPYRAPSWSWASVDGRVNIQASSDGGPAVWLTSFIEASVVVPAGEDDTTAEVQSGSVSLQGPLSLAEAKGFGVPAGIRQEDRYIKSLRNCTGNFQDDNGTNGAISEEDFNRNEKWAMMRWSVGFDTVEDITERFFCLPFRAQPWGEIWHATGLALARQDDASDVYRRVGIVSLPFSDEQSVRRLFERFPETTIEIR